MNTSRQQRLNIVAGTCDTLCNDIESAHIAVVNEMAVVDYLKGESVAFILNTYVFFYSATLAIDNSANIQDDCATRMQLANELYISLIEKRQVRVIGNYFC